MRETIVIPVTARDAATRITLPNIRQESAMRKYLIVFASAALVLTAAEAAHFSGHTVRTKAATTLEPLTMHYGAMPAQTFSDRTFVFDQ